MSLSVIPVPLSPSARPTHPAMPSPRRRPALALATLTVAALTLGALSSGCATRYIPNTDVEDTDENREVIKFCEVYRKALERKDTAALLAIASPRYYEDGGNVDPLDDMDFEGLKSWLEGRFQNTSAIRYEIRYRRVERTEQGRFHVVYTYSAAFRMPGVKESNDEWHRVVADNRLELEPQGETFKILAGM